LRSFSAGRLRGDDGAMSRTSILIVDASAGGRRLLTEILSRDPEIEIVGAAASGEDAIRAAARLRPQIIAMDVQLPAMNGIDASRIIMQKTPCPIVLLVDDATPDRERLSFESLAAGALATVTKPAANGDDPRRGRELLQTVKAMAQVKLVRRWAPERMQRGNPMSAHSHISRPARPLEVVAIGVSTGGPQVVQEILAGLPATFPVPILIVQHMAEGFIAGMADWLRTQCALPVMVGREGEPVRGPGVYLAPWGHHLVVQGKQLAFSGEPEVSGHRPSATVLFRSVARHYGAAATGILLSGMGSDGAEGLAEMKRAGAITVAQDEATCAVFGMPAAAIALGVVDHVLPPPAVGKLLLKLAGEGEGE
jgi:two-component system, chemotaxis family, protein-glutamate methylesterase/glutaminase